TEIAISLDEEALAARGLSTGAVAQMLRTGLAEATVTTIPVDDVERDLVVRFAPDSVDTVEDLRALVLAPGVVLGDVGSVDRVESPTAISRFDGRRSAEVTGTITDANVGAVTVEVDEQLADLDLPAGVEAAQVGGNQEIGKAFSSMFVAMAIA